MLSIYRLVAERRDRNQSMKRQREFLNYSNFNRSISDSNREKDVLYRSPGLNCSNLRYRTVSETPQNIHMRNLYNSNRSIVTTTTSNDKKRFRTSDTSYSDQSVADVCTKIEKLQETVQKQFDELKRELHLIRVRLDS